MQRLKCRGQSKSLQQRGILVPAPCEVCGDHRVERHHEDYTQPMHVRWLCREHHRLVGRGAIMLPPPNRQFISDAAFNYQPRKYPPVPSYVVNIGK